MDYVSGTDVIRDIKINEQANQNQRNLLERIRDYAAYGVAISQRFVLHATALFGLERIVEGKYEQGIIALSVAPFFGALSRAFFPPGKEIGNAKAVVEYLAGADIPRYIKAYEKIVDRIDKRNLPIKGFDYYSYLWIFLGRYVPTILLLDGIRRIAMGQVKWGVLEMSYPIYKYLRDYVRYRRMIAWTKFLEALSNEGTIDTILDKHFPQRDSGGKTPN